MDKGVLTRPLPTLASSSWAAAGGDGFRTDIQALRGLAVLLVLSYHAGLGAPRAGYLGVDIFFVLSGYLVTSIVRDDIAAGRFSLARFYQRRAKRLLPAAYVVFALTAAFAVVLLGQRELRDFAGQLAGALTFSGNIVLWRQIDYFSAAAELKPLLHVWSLAIEEQYYLVLPAALVFLPRRLWRAGAIAIIALSLAFCLALNGARPGVTFYLLPARAWEMALGTFGVLAPLDWLASRLFFPAVSLLLVIPFHPLGSAHPGASALLLCIATLIVIVRRSPVLNRAPLVRSLASVGNFSYSLYLAHWPVFALVRNAWVGEVPRYVNALCTAASLLLGYLLYTLVERPVRRAAFTITATAAAAVVGASLAICALPVLAIALRRGEPDFQQVQRTNYGLPRACEFDDTFQPVPQCQTSPRPEVFVWGDSYAMHLVPGILADGPPLALGQATRTACGPLMDLAPITRRVGLAYNRQWAESCLRFNASVLEYLARTPSVKVVVLSSPFTSYVHPAEWQVLRAGHIEEPRIETGVAGLKAAVEAIRRMDKRAVIVAPPPSAGFDIGSCLERKITGRLNLGPNASCEIPVEAYQRLHSGERALLSRVAAEAGVEVIRFDDYLCGRRPACLTMIDRTFIYRDAGHLSHDGSKVLASRIGLRGLIFSKAR